MSGEFIGLFRLSEPVLEAFKQQLEEMAALPNFKTIKLIAFLNNFARKQSLSVKFIRGSFWIFCHWSSPVGNAAKYGWCIHLCYVLLSRGLE